MAYGVEQDKLWGGLDSSNKKIKESVGEQALFKKGNYGSSIATNLGLYGLRSTGPERAMVGQVMGKLKINR